MHIGKASACNTERRKTKLEGREEANFAVFYDRGRGGGEVRAHPGIDSQTGSFLLILFPSSAARASCTKTVFFYIGCIFTIVYFHRDVT
jgi:hypothetical protein